MKTIQINLPKASEWSSTDNYAENLRMSATGCIPVGIPQEVTANARAQTVSVGNHILCVDADGRTLYVDGSPAGTLGGHFLTALADGERTLIFTDSGVEWLDKSGLQGSIPGISGVEFTTSPSVQLSAEVTPPAKLSGTYTRSSESLQSADCRAMVAPVASALQQISDSALARGVLSQPAWVAWRMIDVDGRTVATGEPQRIGSLKGASSLTFSASKSDNTVQVNGTATLSVQTYALSISIARADSEFWRQRIRTLEVIVWRDCMTVGSTTGHINIPTLTVTPRIEETERSGSGHVAARLDFPLEGVSATLAIADLGEAITSEQYSLNDLKVCALHGAGTINAYALNDEPGTLAVAPAADPFSISVKARICRGNILRICSPAGAGGGWNYGRHHLLVFATDGVYAVSIDGSLTKISATPICSEGVSRSDAVSVAPDAIYMASTAGNLMKLKGARIERITLPINVCAVGWSRKFSELWMIAQDGDVFALSDKGELSLRTILAATRFVEPDLAVDIRGVVRSFSAETGNATLVQWRRRTVHDPQSLEQRVKWTLDAENSLSLRLSILLDNGGAPQTAVVQELNGPINAPITWTFRAPHRQYLTASISGLMVMPSRLNNVAVGEGGQRPRGVLLQRGHRGSW